jgi:hypothetical protein
MDKKLKIKVIKQAATIKLADNEDGYEIIPVGPEQVEEELMDLPFPDRSINENIKEATQLIKEEYKLQMRFPLEMLKASSKNEINDIVISRKIISGLSDFDTTLHDEND